MSFVHRTLVFCDGHNVLWAWRVLFRNFVRGYSFKDYIDIKKSGLFDERWYRANYTGTDRSGLDPIEHYLRHGARQGNSPGPFFNADIYLKMYPDVRAAGFNPLLHYLRDGMFEGRCVISHFGHYSHVTAAREINRLPDTPLHTCGSRDKGSAHDPHHDNS